jgi:hypothetical protein
MVPCHYREGHGVAVDAGLVPVTGGQHVEQPRHRAPLEVFTARRVHRVRPARRQVGHHLRTTEREPSDRIAWLPEWLPRLFDMFELVSLPEPRNRIELLTLS